MVTLISLLVAANATLAAPALTFTVNNSDDLSTCTTLGPFPVCYLRGAILQANSNPGSTINFDPSVTEVFLKSPLPALTASGTLIDGSGVAPVISGISMTLPGDIFVINGNDITLQNLQIINGAGGLFQDHAHIRMVGGTRAHIFYNAIGVKSNSLSCSDGELARAPNYGVVISNAVSGNGTFLQGAAYISSNTIGCHNFEGIALVGADYVLVSDNLVGVTGAGAAIGNGYEGLALFQNGADGAQNNSVFDNIIAANGEHGLALFGSQTMGNLVAGNALGFMPLTGAVKPNGVDGIYLGIGAHDNVIGRRIDGFANYVSGNGHNGITLFGAGNHNTIEGNRIGTNLNGSAAIPNGASGIQITSTNLTLITGNLVSGNTQHGIWLGNAGSNQIAANRVGVALTSTTAISNHGYGILISDGAAGNLIGSTTYTLPNVIAGNGADGVAILNGGSATSNNTIAGNQIGVDLIGYGFPYIANGGPGVTIWNANDNYVGTPAGTIMQYIADNQIGVYIGYASGTTVASANSIGRLAGNHGQGILLYNASNSVIYPENVSFNGGAGISVLGNLAINNRITPLADYSNGGIGIDLGNDGFTPNGAHSAPGPNQWLRYPVITGFAGHVLSGTACAACAVLVYQVKGYPVNPIGGVYVQQTTANGAGIWSTTLPLALNPYNVTLVAVDGTGNTSEMSMPPQLFLPLIRR